MQFPSDKGLHHIDIQLVIGSYSYRLRSNDTLSFSVTPNNSFVFRSVDTLKNLPMGLTSGIDQSKSC